MAAEHTTDMTDGIYRRIYAGYLKSRKINKLSWQAEAWFWRLHSIADDYGNLHGEPEFIWREAAGRRDMTVKEAEALTQEIIGAELAYAYYSDEDVFIHIVGFEDKQPAGKNGKRIQKHPIHPDKCESGGIKNNPGESRFFQNNPGESKIILDNPNYSSAPIPIPIPIPIPTPILPTAGAAASEVPKPKKPKPEPKPREPNPLWDAVALAFFPSGQSEADASLIGNAVKALKAKNALPEEIPKRLARWPTLYEDAGPLTPMGLAKFWDMLAKPNKPEKVPFHLRPENKDLLEKFG